MNKGRRLLISTQRQRSLFISMLKQLGYLRFVAREYVSLSEVSVSYECMLCRKVLERRSVVPHFRSEEAHYQAGLEIVQKLINEGEIESPMMLKD